MIFVIYSNLTLLDLPPPPLPLDNAYYDTFTPSPHPTSRVCKRPPATLPPGLYILHPLLSKQLYTPNKLIIHQHRVSETSDVLKNRFGFRNPAF